MREKFLMKPIELILFENSRLLAHAAAVAWLEELGKANQTGKLYCVALSGGRIAREFFEAIAKNAPRDSKIFSNAHFFWADERCVPPSDPESNYRIASELLLGPLKIPAGQIHRVRGEDAPATAADLAAKELCRLATLDQKGLPILDMIFLGLGEDGHIASLFPGTAAAGSATFPVYHAVADSPKPPPDRVTLDYQTIFAARKIWLLASGAGKEKALRDSMSPDGISPVAQVLQHRDDVKIWTDISWK